MRRVRQLVIADFVVRVIGLVAFCALLLSLVSSSRLGFPIALVCIGLIGLWGLLYPEGPLEWVRMRYPNLDVNDTSKWWVPRLIGTAFLVMAALIAFAFTWR